MKNQTNSPTKLLKTETEKHPTILEQTEADYLAQWEERHKLWEEYYHCCGGY